MGLALWLWLGVRYSVTITHSPSQSVTERPKSWVQGGSTVSVIKVSVIKSSWRACAVIRVQVRIIKVTVTVRVRTRVTVRLVSGKGFGPLSLPPSQCH